jgi:alkanesulfonate monooxygenase SsuD/methylene tetrahydromethanopterin reductase-like flavin-dependent oxidoreductase (luciferase family)
VSLENPIWAAQRAYPFIGLGTALSATCEMWDAYADEAAKCGYQAGSENFGYLAPMILAETEEKAQELGRNFYFGGGHTAFAHAAYAFPPGYNSPSAIKRLSRMPRDTWLGANRVVLELERAGKNGTAVNLEAAHKRVSDTYRKAQASLQTIVGTPESVLPKVKAILDVLRPGTLIIGGVLGNVSDEDRLRSVQLMGECLLPAIKAHGAKIGLIDSFERAPGSVKLGPGQQPCAVTDRARLESLNLG